MSVAAPIAEREMEPPQSSASVAPSFPKPSFAWNADAPAWFQQRATAGWDEFQSLPTPAIKDEAWRYSNAKSLALESLRAAVEASEADKDDAISRSNGVDKPIAKDFAFE